MSQERPPAYAGTFYPDDPVILSSTVSALLESLDPKESNEVDPDALRVLVVPHGDFKRSGPVAAAAYRLLKYRIKVPKRVAIVGPFHHWTEYGVILPSALSFRIPTGSFPVDRNTIQSLAFASETLFSDEAHLSEYSIETHLPFLMEIWGPVLIVPLGFTDIPSDRLAHILDPLLDDPDTFLIVTADFSRHRDPEETGKFDRESVSKVLSCEPVDPSRVCGAIGLNALTSLAINHGLTPHLLFPPSSDSASGDSSQTSGDASFGFS